MHACDTRAGLISDKVLSTCFVSSRDITVHDCQLEGERRKGKNTALKLPPMWWGIDSNLVCIHGKADIGPVPLSL